MRARAGAAVRHGPHQDAQKSTSSGRSGFPTCRRNPASSSARGMPSNSAAWQAPHFGVSASRAAGTRFSAAQRGQTRCNRASIGQVLRGRGVSHHRGGAPVRSRGL